jgi:hypothetical protein
VNARARIVQQLLDGGVRRTSKREHRPARPEVFEKFSGDDAVRARSIP